jgi:hypothetical protein
MALGLDLTFIMEILDNLVSMTAATIKAYLVVNIISLNG